MGSEAGSRQLKHKSVSQRGEPALGAGIRCAEAQLGSLVARGLGPMEGAGGARWFAAAPPEQSRSAELRGVGFWRYEGEERVRSERLANKALQQTAAGRGRAEVGGRRLARYGVACALGGRRLGRGASRAAAAERLVR